MTRSRSIFGMFGHSPIRPLQMHMAKANACAQALQSFFAEALNENWGDAESEQEKIVQLEHDADELKRDLRLHLPKGLFMPVQRSDVLELLAIQDKIANKTKDIAGLILGRQMKFPSSTQKSFVNYIARSTQAAAQANKAIHELDELLETGFRGREVEIVEEMIVKLDDIEHDTDTMQIDLRYQLFELEKDMPPVEVVFLYKIIEWIGDLADRAQSVGGRLQMLLAR